MYCRIKIIISVVILVFFLLISFNGVFAYSLKGKPILSGIWRNQEIEYVAGDILVKIKPGVSSSQIEQLLNANEAFLIHDFDKYRWALVGVDTTAELFEKISNFMESPLVEWAEPNGIFHLAGEPNDSLYTEQWALNNTGQTGGTPDADIDAPEAWDIETGDTSVMIAHLDTGIPLDSVGNLTHPDLSDPDKYILGYDFIDEDTIPNDAYSPAGHGTGTLGILSAMTDNDTGMAGVIWYAKIVVFKLGGSFQDTTSAEDSANAEILAAAIDSARERDAKIIMPVLAGWHYKKVEEAIERAYNANCLIVAPAGNCLIQSPFIYFPGAYASWGENNPDGYRNVICVNATDKNDNPCMHCYGNDLLKLTVSAPGCDVYETRLDGGYGTGLGTSLATPHVAGVAGLILSKTPGLSPDSIRTIIERSADDLGPAGWDSAYGYGRVNALRALAEFGKVPGDTSWSGTVFVSGDVIVPAGTTLTIQAGTVIKFIPGDVARYGVDTTRCEIIVQGNLRVNGAQNDSVLFTTADSTADSTSPYDLWQGIRVLAGGSAKLECANIKYAYCGIDYNNSASDTVSGCHFYADRMYGIKANNSNLVITNNLVEDSSSTDTLTYGIYINEVSPTIEDNEIKGCKYGIYKRGGGVPTLRKNKINKGKIGVYFYRNTDYVTLKTTCFDGQFEETYVKCDRGKLNIDSCYMQGDDSNLTPKGLMYLGLYLKCKAYGTITRSGIFNYEYCGVYSYHSTPNLNGNNSIYSWLDGDSLAKAIENVYGGGIIPFLDARNNWWDTCDEDSLNDLFDPSVLWRPYLTTEPSIYDACTGFGGAPKIVSSEPVPERFNLFQNYPNPFNPQTIIRYNLPQKTKVSVKIYNILGQLVKTLVDEVQGSGLHQIVWEGENSSGQKVSSGIYFYRIQTENFVEVKKMVFIK